MSTIPALSFFSFYFSPDNVLLDKYFYSVLKNGNCCLFDPTEWLVLCFLSEAEPVLRDLVTSERPGGWGTLGDFRVLVVGTRPPLWKTPLSRLARQHWKWINQRGEIKSGGGEEGGGGEGSREGYLTSAFLNWALSSGGMLLSSTLSSRIICIGL